MKKKLLFSSLFILLLTQSWGQNWTRVKLDTGVSVDFPSTPDFQEVGSKKFYQIIASDYIINVVSADMNVYPNFDIKTEELNNFYKGVINGSLAAMSDSKLLFEKEIIWGEFMGREIKYTKDFNGMDDVVVNSRMVLIGRDFFIFEIWDLSGKGQKQIKKEFFNSIRLN